MQRILPKRWRASSRMRVTAIKYSAGKIPLLHEYSKGILVLEEAFKLKQAKRILALFLSVLLVAGHLPISHLAASSDEQELYFTLLHTNDEHSALLPLPFVDHDPASEQGAAGGFARLASAVKAIRTRKQETAEPVLLVSAGDFLTGSPFAWLALEQKAPELSLMLELGYDAITLGNHEFDYGSEALADYLRAAGYPKAGEQTPIVVSNMAVPKEHPLAEIGIRQTSIKELSNGLRIGFFGILGKKASEYTPYAPPITFSDQREAASAAVAELQAAEVDVIVALSHSGEAEEAALAAAVPGIDIIIGGHTHEAFEQPLMVGETIIAQAGTQLSHLGVLEVAFNQVSGKVSLRNQQNRQPFLLPLDASIPFDPVYARKIDQLAEQLDAMLHRLTDGRFGKMNQTILHTDFPVTNKPEMAESAFGNFVTDAMRLVGAEVTGEKVDFAFQANGVIRGGLEPGTLPGREGQIALFDLANQVGMGSGPDGQPGYPLVSIYFTGEEVRRILEIAALLPLLKGDAFFLQTSGLRMEYDPERAILAWIPIKNIPIPTTRAVMKAERYTGSGIQVNSSKEWTPLERGDQELYHVVSDYYLAAFLPMVGDLLPSLGLVMKDKQGNPVSVEDCIVYRDGHEFKVWQAVLEYAASLPPGEQSVPEMPSYYATTNDRLVTVKTLPIWLMPLVIVVALLVLTFTWVRRRRLRRLAKA